MKIISAISDEILELRCSCCNDNHVLRVDKVKPKYYKWDIEHGEKDPTCFYFKFSEPSVMSLYPSLRERIRRAKFFRQSKNYDGPTVLFEFEQLTELFETLKNSSAEFVSDSTFTLEKFNPIKKVEDNYFESFFTISGSECEEEQLVFGFNGWQGWEPNRLYIHDFEIGYRILNIPHKARREYARKYILKRSLLYIQDQESSISKTMLINLLSILKYIIDNKKEGERGIYLQCSP